MRQTKYGRIRLFPMAMGIIAVTLTAYGGSEETLVTDTQASGIAELSTIARYDGSLQIVHRGRPLYFFVFDTAIGDTRGHGSDDRRWRFAEISDSGGGGIGGGGDTGTQFAEGVIVGTVANNALDEVSGCAASQVNTDTFWVHNDSGDSARFYAIGRDGSDLGTFNISGGSARDYEDIAVGPGPIAGRSYVYVGDFGDNFAIRGTKTIYRMLEPQIGSSGSTVSADAINIIYPDGSRDAETLMVDPVNSDVYVVSKRDSSNRVYLFAAPLQDGQTYTGVEVARINISGLVGGDISSDGSRILIKTASSMYLWLRGENETVGEALRRNPVITAHTHEHQGEAVCWSPDGVDYYTTSEGSNQPLYYFRSLDSTNTGGGGGSGGNSGTEGSGGGDPGGGTKVAFIGDAGAGSDFQSVLNLIKAEGAELTILMGDSSYDDSDDDRWDEMIRDTLGSQDPVLIAAGNHDYGDSDINTVRSLGRDRLARNPEVNCTGDYAQKMSCSYKNVYVVLSSIGSQGSRSSHETYIQDSLDSAPAGMWRICAWHKVQNRMQAGGKSDEIGWTAYESCREQGAIIATAHEHSYSRTHLLSDMSDQDIVSTSSDFTVTEGRTFAFVSGLGGGSIRDQERGGDWFARIYTSSQGAKYGALFATFYADRAEFYFKNISGLVIDQFTVRKGY